MSVAYRNTSRNAVLVQDDIGRAKPTCYDLPHEAHAYGRCEQPDLEGAREVTMSWATHVPRAKATSDCQDFIKLNKMAPRAKASSAKDAAEFRRNTDVKLMEKGAAGQPPKVIPSDVIPSFAYGRKSRPSTPISSVIGNQFATEHEQHLEGMYEKYTAMREGPGYKTKVRVTKATSLRISKAREAKAAPEVPKELFKMSKFKKVVSRTNSRASLVPLGSSTSSPNLGMSASAPNLLRVADESS
jgi:hypothetical protein